MNVPKDIVCLIPTWCTSRHAIGAADSLRKYYPNIPIYFINDRFTPDQEGQWAQVYAKDVARDGYDIDTDKLINYPNSCYIQREHEDFETDGHGKAITHAMQFIHAKWIVHISTDIRLKEQGILEQMFEDVDSKHCGVGDDWTRNGAPALGSWLFVFRGDLYHKYNLDFYADRSKLCDIGMNYYSKLIEKGYKFDNHKNIFSRLVHLNGGRNGNLDNWDKYF